MASTAAFPRDEGRYTSVAIALHWLIAAMLVVQIFGGWMMEDLPRAERFQVIQLHKSAGLTILLLTLVRLGWRLANPPPPLPAGMTGWERMAAGVTHIGFYVLILAIPLSGWVMISTTPYTIATMYWGLFEWPKIPGLADLAIRGSLNEGAESAHSALVWGAIVLWALHVGAALKHHFVNRDGVLARMLPFLRPR